MRFYTFSKTWGNNILARGYENGIPFSSKIPFEPTLYVTSSNKRSDWKSLYDGRSLEPMKFKSIKEAKNFITQYEGVESFEVHGFPRWEYQWINEEYPDKIEYDMSHTNILFLDIETVDDSVDDGGFPDIQKAEVPVVLISLYDTQNKKLMVFGLKGHTPKSDTKYEFVLCSSERELLTKFVQYNQATRPDAWTGWNTSGFDIPYLINRISNLFSEDMVKKLSPFGIIKEKIIKIRGKDVQTFEIFGVSDLDYLELYKNFTYTNQESYTLGFISQVELGHTKVDLPGYSFRDNYVNHYDLFVEYSAIDTMLVKELDDKMKLIDLTFAVAYMYRCNLQDVFRTVLPWEVFIFNHLHKKNIAYPPKRNNEYGSVEGAWVKEPKPGLYGWSMSYDYSSLYPSAIIQWNISPETFYPSSVDITVNDFVDRTETCRTILSDAIVKNLTVAANGTMYKKNKVGFLPELMQVCLNGRKTAKREMLKLESEYEKTGDNTLKSKISALNNEQMAFKIMANSAYGAIAQSGFHFYDFRMAEAITLSGQYADIRLANDFNIRFNKLLKTNDVDYVIYGDSVAGDSEITVNGKKITIEQFYESGNNAEIYSDDFNKSYVKPCVDSFTPSLNMTDGNVQNCRILHVMKHRVKKEMFRITIGDKSVIVTGDHSIIVKRNNRFIEVKPKNILPSDTLINIKS